METEQAQPHPVEAWTSEDPKMEKNERDAAREQQEESKASDVDLSDSSRSPDHLDCPTADPVASSLVQEKESLQTPSSLSESPAKISSQSPASPLARQPSIGTSLSPSFKKEKEKETEKESQPPTPRTQPSQPMDAKSFAVEEAEEISMQGWLHVRYYLRKRRFGVLRGREFFLYKSPESVTQKAKPKATYLVSGACDLEEATQAGKLKLTGLFSYSNGIAVFVHKSTNVIVEAESTDEKRRWLEAFAIAQGPTSVSLLERKRTLYGLQSILQDPSFDAHIAVTLMHKYLSEDKGFQEVVDVFSQYAATHLDQVELYLPQLMHIVVTADDQKSKLLSEALISLCTAPEYKEHLGNSIHLALQMYWHLEGILQDKDPSTYNRCALLLMQINARIEDQKFGLKHRSSLENLLQVIPGLRETLFGRRSDADDAAPQTEGPAPDAPQPQSAPEGSLSASISAMASSLTSSRKVSSSKGERRMQEIGVESPSATKSSLSEGERVKLRDWLMKERGKRREYFTSQRAFVAHLTDIAEALRQIHPVSDRKAKLIPMLENLVIPPRAYLPLSKVTDPFSRILSVLPQESTVFSTHSRAPCLICFEVIEEESTYRSKPDQGRNSEIVLPDEASEIEALLQGEQDYLSADEEEEDCDDDFGPNRSPRRGIREEETPGGSPASPTFSEDLDDGPDSGEFEGEDGIDELPWDYQKLSRMSEATIEKKLRKVRRTSVQVFEAGLANVMSKMNSAFGESWTAKKERIRKASKYGELPNWNVQSLIAKSFDDMRQEVFALQLISKLQEIFTRSNLPLWLRPYRIVSTGNSTGLIETITDAISLDALKKKAGYVNLRTHFETTYGGPNSDGFRNALDNFIHSLAGYSLLCYLFQIKDRHNGNILLDSEGHIIHIDFGFLLGIAPGGSFSIEVAPFKLTSEMVQLMGGVQSEGFKQFINLLIRGMLAAQRNAEEILTLVEIMMKNSGYPCFRSGDNRVLRKLKDRFKLHLDRAQTVKFVLKMVRESYKNKWTKRYDKFQKYTNGIIP